MNFFSFFFKATVWCIYPSRVATWPVYLGVVGQPARQGLVELESIPIQREAHHGQNQGRRKHNTISQYISVDSNTQKREMKFLVQRMTTKQAMLYRLRLFTDCLPTTRRTDYISLCPDPLGLHTCRPSPFFSRVKSSYFLCFFSLSLSL